MMMSPEFGDLCVCVSGSKLGKEEKVFIFLSNQGENHYMLKDIETQQVYCVPVDDVVFLDFSWSPLQPTNAKHPLLSKEPGAWVKVEEDIATKSVHQRSVIIYGIYENGSLVKKIYTKDLKANYFMGSGYAYNWPGISTKDTGKCF